MGLGAISDIVQQAFGPVALDRSTVKLAATASPERGCPACAGRRFEFPADLGEAKERMCLPHREQARAVTNRRLAHANASGSELLCGPPGIVLETALAPVVAIAS